MKKGKLLLSLAMMCLSIAVLCFGVLAATSVTYTISGTISYEVSDVFVKINTSVYAIAEQQDKATVITTVKAMESVSQAKTLTINSKTYTRTQEMVEYDSSNAGSGDVSYTAVDNSDNTKGIEIVYGTYYTYYIVINIQNLSASKAVDAILTDNTTAEINSIKTTNLYQNNIASTDTKNIVIAYSIKDKTSSINSAAISYSLKVSYEDKDYTNPIEVTDDETNSYYYVTLGTGKSLDSSNKVTDTDTNIKWRLVSLDGISKYTYNSSDAFEARYLSDAVFLQETVVNSTLAFDTSNSQNYYTSTIRNGTTDQAALKNGSYFNLSSTDTSFIKDRDLGDKLYKYSLTGSYPNYVGVKQTTYVERTSTDATKDKFWLLDMEEVNTFVGDTNTSREWLNGTSGVCFWLRSPRSNLADRVCIVYKDGGLDGYNANGSSYYRVRAAFQLA